MFQQVFPPVLKNATDSLFQKARVARLVVVSIFKFIRILVFTLHTLANLFALLWGMRHTEAGYSAAVVGYYAGCGGYAIRRRGIMLTWWGYYA